MSKRLTFVLCFCYVASTIYLRGFIETTIVLHLFQVSYPDGIDEKKRKLNEKLDSLNKKKHGLVQMLKQVSICAIIYISG